MKKWGKGKVKRLPGAGAGLLFKGSGFYITDYRSEGYKSAAKSDTTTNSTASTGSGAASKGEGGGKSPSAETPKIKKTPPKTS